jgi:hypothetical protein
MSSAAATMHRLWMSFAGPPIGARSPFCKDFWPIARRIGWGDSRHWLASD